MQEINRTATTKRVLAAMAMATGILLSCGAARGEMMKTNDTHVQTPMSASLSADRARPADLADVRLLPGYFKDIQELHRTNVVGLLEPDRLLFPFRKQAGLPQPAGVTAGYGGWDEGNLAGHYGGHYLSAASRMVAATGDASFREKVDRMVTGLAECQAKLGGGYLAAFPATRLDGLESNPQKGLVEFYTIHKIIAGLVDAHAYCGNTQALTMASALADYCAARLAKLSPAQIEALFRTDYAPNPANEFGGIGEALADLCAQARKQGDPDADRHLKTAALFNRDWLIAPLVSGEDRLAGLHGNTHIAQACGMARYALVAGDDRTGRAAEAFWKLVVGRHSFVNGANSFDEKLRAAGVEVAGKGDAVLNAATAETCNTHNMLNLTRTLFALGPSAAYADYYENALYNHILVTIAPDHGKGVYFLPLHPGDYRMHINEPFCCQGTGIENTARFGEAIYYHAGSKLWVNLYIPSTFEWREQGMKVRLETRYPEDGDIRLAITPAKPVEAAIRLRIPGWVSGKVAVSVNGALLPVTAVAGTYCEVKRTWKAGDTLQLRLPLALRVRPAQDDPATLSFFYGPVLLAGELGRTGMPASDVGGDLRGGGNPPLQPPVIPGKSPTLPDLPITPDPATPLLFYAQMFDPAHEQEVRVILSPFYRVHHQRYAVYWKYAALLMKAEEKK